MIDAAAATRFNVQQEGKLWKQKDLPPPLDLGAVFPFDDEPFAHLVATMQIHLGLDVDGKLGKATLAALGVWWQQLEASDDASGDEETIRTIEVHEPDDEPQEEEPPGLNVGAWTGSGSLAYPERDVAFALEVGLTRLDIIVNDHSAAREPRDFTIYDRSKIERLVRHARDQGLEVHVMSWVMPHAAYIDEAAQVLVPLCNDLGISSLQWDAEEPWTRATRRMSYQDAAERIRDRFFDLDCPMGVNGIGYTPMDKFGPLGDVCEYVVPQCYATSSSGLDPKTVVPKFVRRYREVLGAKKQVAVGLAAYRQPPPKYTVESAMAASFASAEAIEGCGAVIYWSLSWIRKSQTITKIVRRLSSTVRASSAAAIA